MSYFPLIRAPGCTGWTTINNYPPNNWEVKECPDKYIIVSWVSGEKWTNECLGVLAPGQSKTFTTDEMLSVTGTEAIPFLSLTRSIPDRECESLPLINEPTTYTPAWRASIGLDSGRSRTCYQGEIDPFPDTASLLTFSPFIQYGENIENYLLFLNLERAGKTRTSAIEVYDAACPEDMLGEIEAKNNNLTVIDLNVFQFSNTQLPVIINRSLAGIPLYFSRTSDGSELSMEHTHPPASLVIHGERWAAQRIIKEKWFNKLKNH